MPSPTLGDVHVDFKKDMQRFGNNLLQKLAEERPGKNVIYSPASISTALGMVYIGADGPTEAQMCSAMFPSGIWNDKSKEGKTRGEIVKHYAAFVKSLKSLSSDKYSLHMANRLYVQDEYPLQKEYMATCRKTFQSEVKTVDFAQDKTCKKIVSDVNKWVKKETDDKIQDFLKSDSLKSDTRLLIVNAVYFKAMWKTAFNPTQSKKMKFMGGPDGKRIVNATFMRSRSVKLEYYEDDTVQVVSIPYGGSSLVMTIFLPRAADGLPALLRHISSPNMRNSRNYMPTMLDLSIPKFKIESTVNLDKALKAMNMTDAFSSDKADFTRINGHEDLFISDVFHKAFIEVNEKGTEAAAASSVVGTKGIRPGLINWTKRFCAEHPFLYTVTDGDGVDKFLFAGVLYDPTSSD